MPIRPRLRNSGLEGKQQSFDLIKLISHRGWCNYLGYLFKIVCVCFTSLFVQMTAGAESHSEHRWIWIKSNFLCWPIKLEKIGPPHLSVFFPCSYALGSLDPSNCRRCKPHLTLKPLYFIMLLPGPLLSGRLKHGLLLSFPSLNSNITFSVKFSFSFFLFFNMDHFSSLYWICYNVLL